MLKPSAMSRAAFVSQFGEIYEYSPWIAGKVWDAGLEARHDVPGYLYESFRAVITRSGRLQQLALLRAHPQLACGKASC